MIKVGTDLSVIAAQLTALSLLLFLGDLGKILTLPLVTIAGTAGVEIPFLSQPSFLYLPSTYGFLKFLRVVRSHGLEPRTSAL